MEANDDPRTPQAKRTCKQKTPVRAVFFDMNCAVKVSSIPETFMEHTFKSFVEKQRLRNSIAPHVEKSIVRLMPFLNESHVYVQFSSADIAKEFALKCHELLFYKNKLIVEYDPPVYDEVTRLAIDETLDVSRFPVGLQGSTPQKGVENLNASHRRSILGSDCTVDDDDLGVYILDNEDAIECGEVAAVQKHFVKMSPFKNRGTDNQGTDKEDANSHVTKLLFENVHQPFRKDHFADFLEHCVSKKCPGSAAQNTKFDVAEYKQDQRTVLVKFQSPKVAEAVCQNLQHVEYMLEPWRVKTVGQALTSLVFENVHPPFKEDDFSDFLELCLSKRCPGSAVYNTKFEVKEYDQDQRRVLVMFHSSEVAESICHNLQFIEYRLEKWTVLESENWTMQNSPEKQGPNERTPECSYMGPVLQSGNLAMHNSPENPEKQGPNECQPECSYMGPVGVVLSEDEAEDIVKLSSEKGKEIFYKALLKTQNYFKSKNNHTTGMVQILAFLESLNVEATIPEISKMRRNLNNCFNTHKRNQNLMWPLYQLCRVVFDGEPPETLSAAIYGDALLPLEAATVSKIFTKGAIFHKQSRSALIRILTANADAYRKGQLNFWTYVSSMMEESGFPEYDSADCHKEFKELEKKFKEVDVMRRKTGGPQLAYITNWEYFKEMEEFFINDVAVHAPITVASGSTSGVLQAGLGVGSLEKSKARANPLKKPVSKADQRNAYIAQIAEQMKAKQ